MKNTNMWLSVLCGLVGGAGAQAATVVIDIDTGFSGPGTPAGFVRATFESVSSTEVRLTLANMWTSVQDSDQKVTKIYFSVPTSWANPNGTVNIVNDPGFGADQNAEQIHINTTHQTSGGGTFKADGAAGGFFDIMFDFDTSEPDAFTAAESSVFKITRDDAGAIVPEDFAVPNQGGTLTLYGAAHFQATQNGNSIWMGGDGFTTVVIPLPAGVALGVVGLACSGFRRHRICPVRR